MRITPVGKVVLLLLVIGFMFGAWRLYGRFVPTDRAQTITGTNGAIPSAPSETVPPETADTSGGSGAIVLPLITSASQKEWLGGEIAEFNRQNAGHFSVEPRYIESREAMQAILNHKEKPVLWCPSSPLWATRLGEVYAEQNKQRIVETSRDDQFRVYLCSPLVFLTTQEKAKTLRPLLGSANAWTNLADLGAGRKKCPWGRFRYSHADPITASSGFLTVGLMLIDYAKKSGSTASPETLANSTGFAAYLKAAEKGLVFDGPAREGSSALVRAFADNPSRYDAITAYESNALEQVRLHPNLAVIYPDPTALAELGVAVVNGDWVRPSQREGTQKFLTYLGGRDALLNGVATHYRTLQNDGPLSLEPELSREAARGFKQSISTVELPGYTALNSAAYQWRQTIADSAAQR